jgi:asparagine synthase (glutamine-hydrolysing)
MCGICGVVDLGAPAKLDAVERMKSALVHRGPDAHGTWADDGVAIGSRRLAILDITDAGTQPFSSDDGRYHLVHNGEIYNYREVRDDLTARGHRFATGTDTEVVLAAYAEWGDECVQRFNGMWAFAVWDRNRRRLFCSRDRFGVKPLYYAFDGRRLVFASEPQALREAGVTFRPNLRIVRDYLARALVDHESEDTFLDGVLRLPPAHNLVYVDGRLSVERWWNITGVVPEGDSVDAVRATFLDAVRLRLRSDVRVGSALSGGIDSSAIVSAASAIARRGGEDLQGVHDTFTAYFPGSRGDERPYAQFVVDATGVQPHWITFDGNELVDCLPKIVAAQGEPFSTSSMAAQWFVMREAARAGVTVMLDGQGGDEVFAGYPTYMGFRFADLLRTMRIREVVRELAAQRSVQDLSTGAAMAGAARAIAPVALKARLRGRGSEALLTDDLRGLPRAGARPPAPFQDALRRQLHFILTRQGLPALLRYEDRNSMAHSIEARLPFLDYRLVELAFSLDGGELLHRGVTKSILRQALGGDLPEAVRLRTDKVGFETPEAEWLRGPLGSFAAEVFASPEFRQRGFVQPAVAEARLREQRDGSPAARHEVWRMLCLELWAREVL